MRRYTFVLEFGGGTYIAQHPGQDLNDAIRTYAQAMRTSPICRARFLKRPFCSNSAVTAQQQLKACAAFGA